MIYQDLYDMLRKKPFAPFRIVATDGRTYDVHHPDQALVLLTRVILPAPTNKDVPESSDHLSISQIADLKICRPIRRKSQMEIQQTRIDNFPPSSTVRRRRHRNTKKRKPRQ